MADKLDPHHLVALMSHIFNGNPDGSSHRLDSTSINPKYGITNRRETSVRTFPILDAIASICVFEEKSQVVAVALQLNPREQQIRLTIAKNQEVEDCVDDHLKSVWRNLQALSNEFVAERRSDKHEEGSPDIPKDVARALRVKIFSEIYQFSLRKEMYRVRRWWRGLFDFVKELDRRRGKSLQGIERELFNVVAGLDSALRLIRKLESYPAQGLTDDEWEEVYDDSMWAYKRARLVLADRNQFGCEILAKELNDSPGRDPANDFRLRHALEKLTSLTRHIECLISFANSPRLRPALQYHMSTATVPRQTRTIELPKSHEQWEHFLRVAAAKKLPWQEDDALGLAERFEKNICVCSPHCACALTQYLTTRHGDSWDNVPAFSYIGVSRLSCGACRVWFEALNEVGQQRFYTRGSHGKWYMPWAIPRAKESSEKVMLEESLGEAIAAKISREYIKNLKDRGCYKSGSDSSDESLSWGKSHLSDDRRESVICRIAARQREVGGTMGQYLASIEY